MTKASQLSENVTPAKEDRIVHRDVSFPSGTQSREVTLENVARRGLPAATTALNGIMSAADKTLINQHLVVPTIGEMVTGTDNLKLMTILRTIQMMGLARVTTFSEADFSPNEFTLDANNLGQYLRFNFVDPIPVTIADDTLGVWVGNARVDIRQVGLGQVQIKAGVGVTINNSLTEGLGLRTKGSTVTLIRTGTNEWDVIGDFEAEGGSPG